MSEIEAELVKLFKFKKTHEDFDDRQEYLLALTQAIEKIKDDNVFDDMTEPTYDWLQDAVAAVNKKREIVDFPDAEFEEPEEVKDDGSAVDAGVGEEAGPEVDEEADEEATEESEAETEEKSPEGSSEALPSTDGPDIELDTGGPDIELDTGESATEEEAPVKPKKPRKKPVKAGKYIKKKKGKPDVEPKHKPGKEPDYKKITGDKNRYGVTKGTKSDLAIKMFEKGHTMRDVNIELGDNYYVLLRRLATEGHLVEKLENKVLKLHHRDDLEGRKSK